MRGTLFLFLGWLTLSAQAADEGSQSAGERYHFRLTKGSGTAVCEAYLKRLNITEFEKPPYCDRPENDSIPGFTRLNRVSMSPSDVRDLYPIVWRFLSLANRKGIDWASMDYQRELARSGQFKMTPETLEALNIDWSHGWGKVWRYDPPVDIDNDGVLDNIEIWEGSALPTGVGGRKCGDDGYPITHYGTLIRQPQIAFVIAGDNEWLDVPKTIAVFRHPEVGYPIRLNSKWILSEDFRPIGRSIGIFEFEGVYYFDTFFDGWGDFDGKRRTVYTRHKDENIVNTLAVFLHKDGKTRQVCEYQMTND